MRAAIGLVTITATLICAKNVTTNGARIGTTSASPQYSLEIYTDCSPSGEGTVTSTGIVTETYCSMCSDMVHTTVYTTTYLDFCPTATNGMTEKIYTITESCTGATPTWSTGPTHIPQGFTTHMETCTMCGTAPITAMMTYPSGSPAFQGSNTAPSGLPSSQSPARMGQGSINSPSNNEGSPNEPPSQAPNGSSYKTPSENGVAPEQGNTAFGNNEAPSQQGNGATGPSLPPTEEGAPERSGNMRSHGASMPKSTKSSPITNPRPSWYSSGASSANSTGIIRYTGAASSVLKISVPFPVILSSIACLFAF